MKNNTTKEDEIIERFEEFLRKRFGNPLRNQTYRWLFCWDNEQNTEPPFDCACCLDSSDMKDCGCICHERIKTILNFLLSEITKAREEVVKCKRCGMNKGDFEKKGILCDLKINDGSHTFNGISAWREYGKKHDYWGYFEKEVRESERREMVEMVEGMRKIKRRTRMLDGQVPVYNKALDQIINSITNKER